MARNPLSVLSQVRPSQLESAADARGRTASHARDALVKVMGLHSIWGTTRDAGISMGAASASNPPPTSSIEGE